MALYEGGDRARTGPYWRRQMGTTLPGERSAAELAAINALRMRMGQRPEGGPALRGAAPAPQLGAPGGVGPMAGEPGAPPGLVGGQGQADLGQLQLPQLLALKAMFAKATAQQQQRPAMPAQRGVLPQLHQAVPVRAHVRIIPPSMARSGYPAY